jgi:hypothetical protein
MIARRTTAPRLDTMSTRSSTSHPAASPAPVARTALLICRRRAPTLAMIGLILFAPLAAIEALAAGITHSGFERGEDALAIGVYLWASLIMFGSAMCAGLLDTVVGSEFGEEEIPLRRAIRSLPYGRLVVVDVVQALVIGTASLVGFVPGLIAFTLTCLAGSLVMIERIDGWAALRRSVALTRRRFGLTAAVVTLPVAVEHQILHALGAFFDVPFLLLWAVHAAAAVVVLVPVVVVEITLAHVLRAAESPRVSSG